MFSIIRSLLWKEFREHLWRMLSLLTILLFVDYLCATYLAPPEMWQIVWTAASWFTPVWIAALTISSENSRRTANTIAALPVSPILVFASKTFCGILTFELPLFLSFYFADDSSRTWDNAELIKLMIAAAMLYLLILTVAGRVRREGMAAMVGLLALLICMIWFAIIMAYENAKFSILGWLLLLPNPFQSWYTFDRRESMVQTSITPLIPLAVTAGYWWISAWRYAAQSTLPPRNIAKPLLAAPSAHQSPLPLSSLRHPLLWKERREQLSILLLTAAVGIGLSVLLGCIVAASASTMRASTVGTYVGDTLTILFSLGNTIPTVIAVILGISAMNGDLDEPLAAFWQSRPLPKGQLFWTKYCFALLGLLFLVVAFILPYFVGIALLRNSNVVVEFQRRSLSEELGQLIWLPLCLSLTFFFAAIMRRAVYAGILIIGVGMAILIMPLPSDNTVATILFDRPSSYLFPYVALFLILTALAATLLARTAFTKNWRLG